MNKLNTIIDKIRNDREGINQEIIRKNLMFAIVSRDALKEKLDNNIRSLGIPHLNYLLEGEVDYEQILEFLTLYEKWCSDTMMKVRMLIVMEYIKVNIEP